MNEKSTGDVLPKYHAEVNIWDTGANNAGSPLFKLTVFGTAKAVQQTIAYGMDAFLEDMER